MTEQNAVDTDHGKMIESLVLRGDLSALGPAERARHYVQMCKGLGLNPSAQPFAYLRLNGKEVLYATRGATDELARIHGLNRELIDGPKVIDLAGTKLVYAVCRATLPNGRTETSTATLPLIDPVNVLMKAETKAKRRATLSILGLGLLDEMELETIPASAQEPARVSSPTPSAWAAFTDDVASVTNLAEATACWQVHAAALFAEAESRHQRGGEYLREHLESIGYVLTAAHATAVLGGVMSAVLCAVYDALAGLAWRTGDDDYSLAVADVAVVLRAHKSAPEQERKEMFGAGRRKLVSLGLSGDEAASLLRAALTPPMPPTGTDGPAPRAESSADAQGTGHAAEASTAPVALVPDWARDSATMAAHVAGYTHQRAVENAVRKYHGVLGAPFVELCAERLAALGVGEHTAETLVAAWARADQPPKALEGFYARIQEIELPGESVALWLQHRAVLAVLPVSDREAAWKALCRRTEEVGKMKNARVWLKKAIAEEDARRSVGTSAERGAA